MVTVCFLVVILIIIIIPPPDYNCFEDDEQKGTDPGPELQLCAYTRDYNRKGWITKSCSLRMHRAARMLCDASCVLSVYKEGDFFPQNVTTDYYNLKYCSCG